MPAPMNIPCLLKLLREPQSIHKIEEKKNRNKKRYIIKWS